MISHTIAALYVARDGAYYGLDDVDPWDKKRDARLYDGPHPVVAHPPCERWGRYWYGGPMLHALGRRKTKGDDGGCFAMALRAVQRFGGVLEHPAASHAWRAFNIVAPPTRAAGSRRASFILALGPATSSRGTTGTARAKRRGSTSAASRRHHLSLGGRR
jgi:hypothetical protein